MREDVGFFVNSWAVTLEVVPVSRDSSVDPDAPRNTPTREALPKVPMRLQQVGKRRGAKKKRNIASLLSTEVCVRRIFNGIFWVIANDQCN